MKNDDPTDGDIIARYLRKGKIAQIPMREAPRLLVLQWLVHRLPHGQRFSEGEINEYLAGHEIDHVTLRRLLVDYGLVQRDHGIYWRPTGAPGSPAAGSDDASDARPIV